MAKEVTEIAKKLRKRQTEAEKRLWSRLRNKKLDGIKFRRQQPIGKYIVDFVTFDLDLVIEVDGGEHMENKNDKERDKWFKEEGFTVIRFWNHQVLGNTDGVLKRIKKEIDKSK